MYKIIQLILRMSSCRPHQEGEMSWTVSHSVKLSRGILERMEEAEQGESAAW